MAGPLKITADNNLQEMTSGEQDYIEHVLLGDFASADTGVGTVSVNPGSTTGLTLIGTFTDTRRTEAVGTHPAAGTTTTVNTYNFYQDRQTASESISNRPVEYDGSSISEQTDATIDPLWIDSTQDNLVGAGLGSYVLQPSAPSGGTWTEKGTLTNTIIGGSSNTTKLWRKTVATSVPTTVRPLKLASSNVIQEMSDTEIKQFTPRLRNKIKAGIGQYQLATSAPGSGGTWAAAGSAFSDTRRQVTNQSYSGSYTGTYSQNFAGSYTGYYARYQAYTGQYLGNFAGTYTGYYTGYFSGTYTGSYTGATVQSATENASTLTLWVRTA